MTPDISTADAHPLITARSAEAPPHPAKDAPGRLRRATPRLNLLAAQIGIVVLFLLAWELIVDFGWIDEFFISKPSVVAGEVVDLVQDDRLYSALWVTSFEVIVGLAIGGIAGVVTGLLLGARPYLFDASSPLLMVLYTTPRLAMISVFILWFGIGPASKIAIIVTLVFFSMLFNTYSGVRHVDEALVDAVRLMGGRSRNIIRQVYVPSTAPWIFAGLRVSLIFALTGAVVSEMLASRDGLGYLVIQRSNVLDAPGVVALLVILAVMSNLLNAAIGKLEKKAVHWKPEQISVNGS